MTLDKIYTAKGHPTHAFVSYIGQRDANLNLPNNSSIGMALAEDKDGNFLTRTSVIFSKRLSDDILSIDGAARKIEDKGVNRVINELRRRASTDARVLIRSENKFPSDAGIASSGSGLATLAFVCSQALDLQMPSHELSAVARLGSGSAARSIVGGVMLWHKGSKPDGQDSYAQTVNTGDYWSDLIDIVAVVSTKKKEVSTSEAHRRVVETSHMYEFRPELSETRVKQIMSAIRKNNFNVLAHATMDDSDNMHACFNDCQPTITYLNGTSGDIINKVRQINHQHGTNIAAYSFGAGANAHIITMRKHQEEFTALLNSVSGVLSVNPLGLASSGPELVPEHLIKDDDVKSVLGGELVLN